MEGLFLNYNREPDTTAENATKVLNGVPVTVEAASIAEATLR